ncbi:MAG: hypothetical protein ACRC8A_20505 [Microcoleaceae cyanobacterium]
MWKFVSKLLSGESSRSSPQTQSEPTMNPLSDAGYEALFLRLMEGIGQGWKQDQVIELLGKRQGDRFFFSWLKRFGQKLLDSPLPQAERAEQMIGLAALSCGEISEIAGVYGQQLKQKKVRLLTEEESKIVFQQLLQGVNTGWDSSKIEQFFQDLGESGKPEFWLDWLQQLQEKEFSSPTPSYDLSPSLKLLGEQISPLPEWQEFGIFSTRFGQVLCQKQDEESIWEYDGFDVP